MKILYNAPLERYHTFAVAARCKRLVICSTIEDVVDYTLHIHEDGPFFILGGGSDVLFTKDFTGTVLLPMLKGIDITEKDEEHCIVKAGAGEKWDDFVLWCNRHGLWGVENLSGIPGHVGASPVQNVGAYGVEAGNCIQKVEAVKISDGTIVCFSREECGFRYRNSVFKSILKNQYIITHVYFKLLPTARPQLAYKAIKQAMDGKEVSLDNIRNTILAVRNSKLPDPSKIPNGGSFFKNPIIGKKEAEAIIKEFPEVPIYPVSEDEVKISAGWLIEQCGWKGKSIGNAGVYSKQALVIVNLGNASGNEIDYLAKAIQKDVLEKFSVRLEPEVYIL